MKTQRITRDNKPTAFPCWVYVEGAGITLWGHWTRCPTEGHYIMESHREDSSASYWHPDQVSEPAKPF